MLIDEKINDLQNLTKQKITYDDIAKIFNVSRSAIQNRISRKQPLKDWEEQKLNEFFQLNSFSNSESFITAEYIPDILLYHDGGRPFNLYENKEIIYIPTECFIEPISKTAKYYVINAIGNAMQPFIYEKDKLIIRQTKENEQIIDNKVYIFCFEDQLFVKRLIKNINQLIIISDNKDQQGLVPIVLTGGELNKLSILGQIAGLMRDCR